MTSRYIREFIGVSDVDAVMRKHGLMTLSENDAVYGVDRDNCSGKYHSELGYSAREGRACILHNADILGDVWRISRRRYVEHNFIKCVTRCQNTSLCTVERLLVESPSGAIMDLVLVQEYPVIYTPDSRYSFAQTATSFSSLLFIDRKDSGLPPVMFYQVFNISVEVAVSMDLSLLTTCRNLVGDFVERKTGLKFVDGLESVGACTYMPWEDWFVFPTLMPGRMRRTRSVKSLVVIGRDVYAPSYIAFSGGTSLSYFSPEEKMRLGGLVVSSVDHDDIAFCGEPFTEFVTVDCHTPRAESRDLRKYLGESGTRIRMLEFSEKASLLCDELEIRASLGMTTPIMQDVSVCQTLINAVGYSIDMYNVIYDTSLAELISSPRETTVFMRHFLPWEPSDAIPVRLGDLRDTFVALIAADTSDGFPNTIWVFSESWRWYEYVYENETRDSLRGTDLDDTVVSGMVDISHVLWNATEYYILAESPQWRDYTLPQHIEYEECGMTRLLRSLVHGLNTVTFNSGFEFVSMTNDMRDIWKVLSDETIRHKYLQRKD